MLKLSTSHVSGVLALITAAFVMNGVACSSSKPAKKAGAGGAEEEDCESTSTKKSTSKLTDEFELTQTGTGSNSSTGSGTGTKSGTATGTGTEEDGPTYNGEVKTLIDKKCASSGCHAKGGQDPDLSTLANIKKEKEDFYRTLDPDDEKKMPPTGALKADELKLLEDWKEADFAEGKAEEEEEEETGSSSSTKTATSTSKSTSKCGSSSKKTEEEEEEE